MYPLNTPHPARSCAARSMSTSDASGRDGAGHPATRRCCYRLYSFNTASRPTSHVANDTPWLYGGLHQSFSSTVAPKTTETPDLPQVRVARRFSLRCRNPQLGAEWVTVPADVLAGIPAGLDFFDAAPMGCAGVTTFNAVRHAKLPPSGWRCSGWAGWGISPCSSRRRWA